MEVHLIFGILLAIAASALLAWAMKYCARRFKKPVLIAFFGILILHFTVACIFGLAHNNAFPYSSYIWLFVVNSGFGFVAALMTHQISKLRIAQDVYAVLLLIVIALAFPWVIFAGTGNGQGAAVLPLPAALILAGGFYYGINDRLDACFFASAFAQLALTYVIFWNGVNHHSRKL